MRTPIIDPIRVLGVAMMAGGAGVVLWSAFGIPAAVVSEPLEVPSLTVWGKVFSCLLLAALGAAYLVWRRPVVKAQAGVWLFRLAGYLLTGVDTLGILASGAIVAFVIHLLLLSRRGGRTASPKR